jgi:hypothetical protein
MGLEDTESGEFYRHCFALFGGSDCPSHQQRFTEVLARVMNRAGKKLGWPDTETTAEFMDDGHGVQLGEISEERAKAQYVPMIKFMNELGVQDSEKKRVEPVEVKSYIGFEVDSV